MDSDVKDLRMVWVDLEMTGLDPLQDRILEIAIVVTDKDLNVVAEGPCRIIHESRAFLERLPEEQKQFLHKDGLWDDAPKSTHLLPDVEDEVVAFLEQQVPKGVAPLCGNTISKDREFLTHHMPRVVEHLHYRNIDVSSLKELARRWKPELLGQVKKKETHRARDDIYESIEELKLYRRELFNF
jgi:oligoribonuclease